MSYGEREKLMLRALSENSRSTVTELAKIARLSRVTAAKLLDRLTRELDIRFTLEVDPRLLGMDALHILTLKFARKPDVERIRSILEGEQSIHFAYLTEGHFDLVLYSAMSDPQAYISWETLLIQKLSEYGVTKKAMESPYLYLGFIPFNSSFAKDAIGNIDEKDRKLLRLLDENSRISYTDLAKKTRLNKDVLRYRIFNLKKAGIIKKFTIAVQKPPQQFILLYFENWKYTKNYWDLGKMCDQKMMEVDGSLQLLNTFQMAGPTTGNYDHFEMAIFDDKKEAMEKSINTKKAVYKTESYEVKYAYVTGVLKGLLPIRNLDLKANSFVPFQYQRT